MENRSAKNMLNNNRPSTEPWGTPKIISNHALYELFTLFCLTNSHELILK